MNGDDVSAPPANGHGPLSWRDVYKAVGDSEERVIDAIEAVHTDVKDHETRLRSIEQFGTLPLQAVKTDVARLETRLVPLETDRLNTSAAGVERRRLADIGGRTIAYIVLVSNFIVGIVVIIVNALTENRI